MCGRYYRTSTLEQLEEDFEAEATGNRLAYAPGYNIAPTTTQPVIRQKYDSPGREMAPMRWGLVGSHFKAFDPKRSTFNARAEAVESSPLWRGPFHRRRCLVPVEGYFEWKKPERTPFRFTLSEPGAFALAGLWDAWRNPADDFWLESFAIITTAANTLMAAVHDRMPVILHRRDYDCWLDCHDAEHLPVDLLVPYESDGMSQHLAHPKVGNSRNQGAEMLNSA